MLDKENRCALRRTLAALAAAALLVSTLVPPANAQQNIKILTPTNDSCAIFTTAMDSGDPKVVALSGWALGFLSGVAQGTGVDILRGATAEGVMNRLYRDCQKQPGGAVSVVLEEMARSLVTGN
jgi:hypothetical protein